MRRESIFANRDAENLRIYVVQVNKHAIFHGVYRDSRRRDMRERRTKRDTALMYHFSKVCEKTDVVYTRGRADARAAKHPMNMRDATRWQE